MSSESGPTPPSERIVSLDALRGFALLGILPINIWVFSMPEAVLLNPTVYGDFTGVNYAVWLGSYIFAQQKLITLFTIMFGAGVVLFTESKQQADQPVLRLHYRRTVWLLLIGLAHAYLLWYGDILVTYGLSALLIVHARHWQPSRQARVAIYLLVIPSVLEITAGLSPGAAGLSAQWTPPEAAIQREIETYLGGWLTQMEHRIPTAFRRQTVGFLSYSVWRTSGLMLFGMALFRRGVLSNERDSRFYFKLVGVGSVIGMSLILTGVLYISSQDWAVEAALFWRQFNYWGSLFLAGAYIGGVMLYCRRRPEGVVTKSLVAVGRTAFSNYLLQTVLATSIFYGHGLGLFGQLSRIELLGVVVSIWAVQIPLSVFWLRYFRFGPVEWVWRVLTYKELQPIRKSRG